MTIIKPDLQSLIAREQVLRFVTQLNAISPAPLSLIDDDGNVIYRDSSIIEEAEGWVEPADNSGCFPIEINGIQMGTLILDAQVDISSESVKHLVEILTDRLAYELEVDGLASEIISSYQELNMFYEISETLSSVLDVETICSAVLKQAADVIGSETACMMLLDPDGDQLVVAATTDTTGSQVGLRMRIEDSIYGSVVHDQTTLVVEDAEKYPDLRDKINGSSALFATPLICVPVMVKSEVSGLISMSGKLSQETFTSEDVKLLYAIGLQAGMSLGHARLYSDLQGLFLNTVETLAAAVGARDPRTYGHCRRVAKYSVAIGEEMGLPGKEINDLRLAGILHDIGKIGMPESTLKQPDRLSEKESEELRNHPVEGARIIQHIEQMNDIALWIRSHHERYNGTGYPDSLRGEEIPLCSRILAVADLYDTVASAQARHVRYPHHMALAKLETRSGSWFDPEIVNIFLNLLRENAYEQYVAIYESYTDPPTPRLSRLAYYRINNEIAAILKQGVAGSDPSAPEQMRVQELRSLILYTDQ